jgi:predicted adenylyl cyclase CyaB
MLNLSLMDSLGGLKLSKEIEVKILEVDKPAIEAKLLALGATKTFEGDVFTSYYDRPDESIKKKKELLRIRKKGDVSLMAFKHGRDESSGTVVVEELEFPVDFETGEAFLEGLGFIKTVDSKKFRTSYELGDVMFEFDDYKTIPVFMEIEAPTIDIVNEWISKLELPEDKVSTWTNREVLDHYGDTTN